MAIYDLPAKWRIAGEGARLPGGSRADAATWPFTMDPVLNREIKLFISGWLNGIYNLKGELSATGKGVVAPQSVPLSASDITRIIGVKARKTEKPDPKPAVV